MTKILDAGPPSGLAKIFSRVLDPDEAGLTPEVARFFLGLNFREEDRDRVATLSAKAQGPSLTPEERAELEEYLRAGDFLALLHAKARASLKRAGARPDADR